MYRVILAGVLPALITVAAGGAEHPPVVSEAEFLAVLDADHPAIVESAEALARARASVVEASTLADPVVGAVRENPSGPVEQTDWTLSWQLPGADRRPRVEARERAVDGAAARLEQRLLSLRLAMREVYAEWAVVAARRRTLNARAERVARLAERQADRAEHGEASGLEAHRLELATAELRSRLALSSAAEARARAQALAWNPTLPPDARPVLPEVPPAPPAADTAHAVVRAAEADLAAARLEGEAAGRFVASPELSVGWQRQESGAASIDGPLLGVAWSIPLFDRNRARRATAEARISGARARLEQVRRRVTAERAAARATFERLAAARADAAAALSASERMLDGAEAAFRHGETDLTDLLDTHRAVSDGELAVLDLHAAALAAHRDLVRLVGPDARTADPKESQP